MSPAPLSSPRRWITPRTVAWAFRAVWATLPLTAGPALSAIFTAASSPVRTVGTIGLWLSWLLVLIAALVPTAVSLTVVRLLSPGSLVAVGAAVVRHAGGVASTVAASAAVVAIMISFAAEFGVVFVQGSAYGDESRFPLRPPGPLLLGPLPIGWLLTAAGAVAGPLLLADRQWVTGAVVAALGGALSYAFARRCHRLSRRFLVFVPSGVVVHDHMVLTDTCMFRRSDVAGLSLALADTEAADLTGKALGNAVEISLHDFDTVVLAATPKKPGGTALHVRSLLVSPSRPGAVLAEAARRKLRLG